jgi:hypothetical protein
MEHVLDEVRRVTDHELLSRVERLVKADRVSSVKLLVHLGEVEARKLYLERGFSSMYDYCMTALGMSEAETYLRLLAAKTGKRFPLVLERLAQGGLNLTSIKLLHPLLTEENHVALLDRARGMSKRQLEVLVAELAPKPDFPERVRKLPELRGVAVGGCEMAGSAAADGCDAPDVAAAKAVTEAPHVGGTPDALALATAAAAVPFVLAPTPAPGAIAPLSPGRFKLELTLGQEAHDQLEQLRELLRHQNPSGEITRIVELALRELLERTLKRRFAQTASPRRLGALAQRGGALDRDGESKASSTDADDSNVGCLVEDPPRQDASRSDVSASAGHEPPGVREDQAVGAATSGLRESRSAGASRYVPRFVLREVYARDAGRCSYVSADGRRCSALGFLEVHHHEAFARGGEATVENLRLTCRAHNFWLAEREMGRGFMQGKLGRTSA